MASKSLGVLTLDLIAKVGGFEAGMDKAARTTAKRMAEIEKRAKLAGVAIGTALAAGATTAAYALKSTIDSMDEMSKAAQKAGLPTEDFSKLTYAAGLADVSMETLVGSLGKLTKAQAAALKSTSEQARVFDALGISATNADGSLRNSADVLADFADKFQALKGSPEAMAAGFALFGRSFQEMIPLLKDGGDGIRDAGAELESFGGVLSTQAGQAAEEFNDNLTRLKTIAVALGMQVATDLLPRMVEFTENIIELASEGSAARDAVETLGVAFDGIVSVGGSVVSVGESIRSILSGIGQDADNGAESLRQLIQSARGLAAIPASMLAYLDAQVTGSDEAAKRFRAANAEMRAAWDGTKVGANTNPGKAFEGLPSYLGGPQFNASFSAVGATPNAPDAAALRLALAGGPPKAKAGKKAGESDAEKEAKRLLAAYESLKASQSEQIALFGQTSEAAKLRYELEHGELSKLDAVKKAGLILDAEKLDTLKAEADVQKELDEIEKRRVDAIADSVKRNDEMISDMEFELSLIGLTNAAREKEIALRYAGADATAAQVARIGELVDATQAAAEKQAFADDVQRGLTDAVVDYVSGAKSAKEAFGDFADALFARALQFVADKAIQAMFDAFSGNGQGGSTTGAASGASGWAGLLSAFVGAFGGGRASGGPVMAGSFYEVGEGNRPEMFKSRGRQYLIPGNDGAVVPMRGGSGVQQTNHFHLAAPTEPRTQQQIAARTSFEVQRATSRNR